MKGKVALVTGAGRGIGRALLELLTARSYTVIALVRSLLDLDELQSFSAQTVYALRADVTEASTETVLRDFLSAKVAKVDLLINNAGYGASGYGIEGLKFDELDKVLAVHCHGPIRCVRAALPFLRAAENAAILNISSRFASLEWVASGTVPHDQATYAYRIAKASMNMFSACLAVEMKESGIRVLSIDPGKVKTRFGPQDADTDASASAAAILELADNNSDSGLFLHASGEKIPW